MSIVRVSAAVITVLLLSVSTPGFAKNKPNIVFMLVDNFGYGDLGSYGGGIIRGVPTPKLDRLAAQGMRLTNFNVEAECTPSRSAFLTGRMPIRSGTSAVELMGGLQGMTPWEYTLAEIDHNAGRVIDAVDKAGIAGETIVIFASDNGPETMAGIGIQYGGQSDSGPFRGEFPSGWEGAIRVPAIIRWPGHTQPGRVSNEIVSMLDFYRSFATVAGGADRVPVDRPVDSVDQSDFLFGEQQKSNREHVMIFHGEDLLALKWRNYKVHFQVRSPSTGPVVQAGQGVVTATHQRLAIPYIFDLENDPKELWNINAANNWLTPVLAPILRNYAISTRKYPNLKPGSAGPTAPGGQ